MSNILSTLVWMGIVGIASLSSVAPASTQRQCAHYLGNEGVMVESDGMKILIDAFYSDSHGQYALVPSEIIEALHKGQAPFDDVSALFVSHVHGDHFSPKPTLDFIRAQPSVRVYASGQVIDALKKFGATDKEQSRFVPIILDEEDNGISFEFGKLTVDVVRIPHAGGRGRSHIENLAFRVTLDDGLTVLHLGDAGPNDAQFERHQRHWDKKPLDVAFPPYWFFNNNVGERILEKRLKAKQAIGVHVPSDAIGQGTLWRLDYGGDLFTDPGETRDLGGGTCTVSN